MIRLFIIIFVIRLFLILLLATPYHAAPYHAATQHASLYTATHFLVRPVWACIAPTATVHTQGGLYYTAVLFLSVLLSLYPVL